jgi:dephospho-CoA kinase
MLELKKIAITGGLASGKSTVCQFFQELGAYVVNADTIVHELLKPQTDLGQKIIHLLGSDILQNGKIDRQAIARKVFQDRDQLRKLENILHPAVLTEIAERYQKACLEKKYTSFVVEIPLLFEIGAEKFYDVVITVLTNENTAKARFQAAGHTEQEYEERMSRQLPPKTKAQKANYTIINNGSLSHLLNEVKKLNTLIGVSLP